MKKNPMAAGICLALSLSPIAVFAADTIPFEIPRACTESYENLERDWDTRGILQSWSGMSDLMTACEVDESLAAKSIKITIDKAGLDANRGRTPTPSGVNIVLSRYLARLKKQNLVLEAELVNGKRLNWNFTVSTGNPLSDGKDLFEKANTTPAGLFDLAIASKQLSVGHKIQNSQAYCVQGKQYNYRGATMPYAIFFKPGYAIHSGQVTGAPESHGCVRLDPHSARQLYCLLRQKIGGPADPKNKRASAENFSVTKIKICENLARGCDEKGNTTQVDTYEEPGIHTPIM